MRRITSALVLVTVLAACSGQQPLTDEEALWCRVYVPPFLIENEAQAMGIDISAVMDEGQIAYDLEGVIGADPLGQMDAFYDVVEAADEYIEVCRAIYERRP